MTKTKIIFILSLVLVATSGVKAGDTVAVSRKAVLDEMSLSLGIIAERRGLTKCRGFP